MGRTWLLLEREASAGGSKEGALVLGCGGHFQSALQPTRWCWLLPALPRWGCVLLAQGYRGWDPVLLWVKWVARTHAGCSPDLGPLSARWCLSWPARCPGQLRTCRSCCREWADTRPEPLHPSRTGR